MARNATGGDARVQYGVTRQFTCSVGIVSRHDVTGCTTGNRRRHVPRRLVSRLECGCPAMALRTIAAHWVPGIRNAISTRCRVGACLETSIGGATAHCFGRNRILVYPHPEIILFMTGRATARNPRVNHGPGRHGRLKCGPWCGLGSSRRYQNAGRRT